MVPSSPRRAGFRPVRSFRASLAAVVLSLALPAAVAAAAEVPEPRLFDNLLTTGFEDADADPRRIGPLGDVVLFSAEADGFGRELWRTDGTPRGTFLVADLCPGTCGAELDAVTDATADGLIFLEVRLPGGNTQLWRTDGTAEGTFRLASVQGLFVEGTWNPRIRRFVFHGHSPAAGGEPWVSDGSRAGTRPLADLRPGPDGSTPALFFAVGEVVYFAAGAGPGPRELWRTAGTAGTTVRVTGFAAPPAENGLLVRPYFAYGDRLIVLWPAGAAFELWSVSPLAAPQRLADLSGAAGAHVLRFTPDRRRLLLLIGGVGDQPQLWASDGTVAGTRRLVDVRPAPGGAPAFLASYALGDRTLFYLHTPPTGREPWITDGTPEGTRLLADLCPGPCSSGEGLVVGLGDGALLLADDGVTGTNPWVTDGTPDGTRRLADVCPGPCSPFIVVLGAPGYFVVRSAPFREELWWTDGTPAGTRRVAEMETVRIIDGAGDGAALLAARVDLSGVQPWWIEGPEAEPRLLGLLLTGRELGSDPDLLVRSATAAGERLFFVATGNDGRRTLWVSDGTPAGTAPVPGSPELGQVGSFKLRHVAGAGGTFLLVEDPDLGPDGFRATLWWTDGTVPVRQVARIGVGRTSVGQLDMAGNGERLFLLADGLWTSDGTVAGTVQLVGGFRATVPGQGVLVGDRFVFVAPEDDVPFAPPSLWRSDGTPAGTVPWFHDPSWDFPGTVGHLAPDGAGGFWFVARQGEADTQLDDQLWRSDGTVAGTGVAVPLDPSVQPRELRPAGDRVFFTGRSGSGAGWWVSDGTPTGTVDLQTAGRGPALPAGSVSEAVFRGELVFLGSDRGLNRTAGTQVVPLLHAFLVPPDDLSAGLFVAAGRLFVATRLLGQPWQLWMLEDLDAPAVLLLELPGTSFGPTHLTPLGDRVFFAAFDEDAGVEPWVLDFDAPPRPEEPRCVPAADHLCLQDGRFLVRVDWRDPRSGDSGTAGAVPFPGSDRTGTFWFFDPANVELLVKVLDGRPVNGFYWTFYGALSDVEYWVDVNDLETGWRRTYHNPPREICGRADTGTFEGVPAAASAAATAPVRVRRVGEGEAPSCADPAVLCLDGDRFRATVGWRDPRSGDTGRGIAIPGTGRTGYFWFFRNDNVELVTKVLDGTPVNGFHWVFWGALTDVEYELAVVDVEQGEERTYRNPPGNVCGGADTAAF